VTLAEFLLARIADDEAAARVVMREDERHPWGDRALSPVSVERIPDEVRGYLGGTWGEHFARWDPARVLAECDAKRRIVTECGWVTVMQLLALPYADHPDFRDEWAVS